MGKRGPSRGHSLCKGPEVCLGQGSWRNGEEGPVPAAECMKRRGGADVGREVTGALQGLVGYGKTLDFLLEVRWELWEALSMEWLDLTSMGGQTMGGEGRGDCSGPG